MFWIFLAIVVLIYASDKPVTLLFLAIIFLSAFMPKDSIYFKSRRKQPTTPPEEPGGEEERKEDDKMIWIEL